MDLKKIIRESLNDWDWADEITSDPIKFYFDQGFKSVGIFTDNNEDIKELLNNLYRLGYNWNKGSEPNHLYSGDGNLIIWVTKFGKTTNIQFSDTDWADEYGEDKDIIIDNPFGNL